MRRAKFQSTPGISAGRYPRARIREGVLGEVSIHARHFCRAIPVRPGGRRSCALFQSTPGISAGRYMTPKGPGKSSSKFQSTPGISAGRYRKRRMARRPLRSFNPRPAFLPGDTPQPRATREHSSVSIHARHFCRAIPRSRRRRKTPSWFQSTPGISAGRYRVSARGQVVLRVSIHARHFCRAIRAQDSLSFVLVEVSIHARHFCRAIRNSAHRIPASSAFQSTPGISAGRYTHSLRAHRQGFSFNPRPAFLPGDTRIPRYDFGDLGSFNPRPAFLPGDTRAYTRDRAYHRVSIHARHFCRAIRFMLEEVDRHQWFQSTPGISAGRYAMSDIHYSTLIGFNPRPAFLPGDTAKHFKCLPLETSFNPRPAFLPGDTMVASFHAKR